MEIKRSDFNPFSSEHHALKDIKTLNRKHQFKAAGYTVLVSILTLGILTIPTFRHQVAKFKDKESKNPAVEKTKRLSEGIINYGNKAGQAVPVATPKLPAVENVVSVDRPSPIAGPLSEVKNAFMAIGKVKKQEELVQRLFNEKATKALQGFMEEHGQLPVILEKLATATVQELPEPLTLLQQYLINSRSSYSIVYGNVESGSPLEINQNHQPDLLKHYHNLNWLLETKIGYSLVIILEIEKPKKTQTLIVEKNDAGTLSIESADNSKISKKTRHKLNQFLTSTPHPLMIYLQTIGSKYHRLMEDIENGNEETLNEVYSFMTNLKPIYQFMEGSGMLQSNNPNHANIANEIADIIKIGNFFLKHVDPNSEQHVSKIINNTLDKFKDALRSSPYEDYYKEINLI